jgi:tetraacyldisaccharide 4'-kinase
MYLEVWWQEVVQGRRNDLLSVVFRFILYLFSLPYYIAIWARNRAYDLAWFKSWTPPIPLVISVGNIVVGGTGKTPVTLLIAKVLSKSVKTAILTRGYRSQAEKLSTPVLLHKEGGVLHPAVYVGDEPLLLAENVEKALIFVGKNRIYSSNLAVNAEVKALILDDGLQHRRLSRDFDVVVVDSQDLFGQGHFLPRGFLRDEISSLKRANLIVLNHIKGSDDYIELCKQMAPLTQAPVVGTKVKICELRTLKNEPVETIVGKKIALFCGIAKPEIFYLQIKDLGAEIVVTKYFPDHESFLFNDLLSFATRAQAFGAEALVCTEKDKVKLVDLPALPIPVIFAKMELEIVEGASFWEEFLKKCNKSLGLV